MFTPPIDVGEGNWRRKQLLQKLMQRFGFTQGSQSPTSAAARPLFGGGRPFFMASNLPPAPIPQLTRPFPIPPTLRDQLGPGAIGTPLRGDHSLAPGLPVGDPAEAVNQPSQPGPPPPGVATPTNGPSRGLFGETSPPVFDPSSPYYTQHPQITPSQFAASQPTAAPSQPAPAAPADPTADVLSGSLIPLGGGVYFNPQTGNVHGGGMGRLMGN